MGDPAVEFRLDDVVATPGSRASVPFFVRSNAGVQGFSFSIDFNEEILQVDSIEEHFSALDEGFRVIEYNNANELPGDSGIAEGFVIGANVVSFRRAIVLPPDRDNRFLDIRFDVRHGDEELTTQVRFLDGGQGSGQPARNAATVQGALVDPQSFGSFVLVDCLVHVLPDVSVFIRGDANGDGELDTSDALTTLGYLFLGERAPACFDASDTNDDGVLNIADPVYLLQYLFLGGSSPDSPFPEAGEDPTEDDMSCSVRGR